MIPNIVIIIIDALRAKNLGCYGYDKYITSNIDKLAEDNLIFDNAFSTINTTDPSLTAILTGMYPSSHGITAHGVEVQENHIENFVSTNPKFLQEILKSYKYRTIGIDFLGRWHKIGFDEYLPEDKKKPLNRRVLKKIYKFSPSFLKQIFRKAAIKRGIISTFSSENFRFLKYLRDEKYTNIAINKIKEYSENKSPFFILLHYWSVHMPYDPPPNYLEDLKNMDYGESFQISQILRKINGVWRNRLERYTVNIESTQDLLARYDACIKFVDIEIGKIITTLKEEKVFNNTILLITSDHGESLTEHGIYFDHHGLYDETIRVPLIIKLPKINHKRIDALIQHIDIVPSILDYLNISSDEDFDGMSILPLIEDENKWRDYIYAEEYHTVKKKAIRTKRYKYIYADSEENAFCKYCGKIHSGIEELYDLKLDPDENNNIMKEKLEITKTFNKLLNIKLSQLSEKSKISKVVENLKKTKEL